MSQKTIWVSVTFVTILLQFINDLEKNIRLGIGKILDANSRPYLTCTPTREGYIYNTKPFFSMLATFSSSSILINVRFVILSEQPPVLLCKHKKCT